ncbi:hypothetical protein KWH75_06640 [Morganella morganii]|nr:hypothetical protein [Morganella morganii]
MPYTISDHEADFNAKLKMPAKNIEHTELFIQQGADDFCLPGYELQHAYRLLKAKNKHQYRLIAESDKPETAYLVELKFRGDIVYGKQTCTQIKVWRSVAPQHQEAVHNLPRKFFSHLLDEHSIVVTDEEQTNDGKRFWETMIQWAFVVGYHVYISDGTEEDRPLSVVKNTDELYEKWESFCWGNDRDIHTHRLAVISKEQLQQN